MLPIIRVSFLTSLIFLALGARPGVALQQGDKAPLVTLSTAKGKKIDVMKYAQDQKKRNLLLVFFRTGTCGICVAQLEEIATEVEKFQGANAAILSVSLDDAIVQSRTSERISDKYPILLDPDGKTAKKFGVYNPEEKLARPSVFLIDSNQKILYGYIGKGLQDRPTTPHLLQMVRHYSGMLPEADGRAVTGESAAK